MEPLRRDKRPQSVPISGVLPPQALPQAFPVLQWQSCALCSDCVLPLEAPTSIWDYRGSSGISTSSRDAGTPLQTLELTALSIQIAPDIICSAGACSPQRASRPRVCEGSSALQRQLPSTLLQRSAGPPWSSSAGAAGSTSFMFHLHSQFSQHNCSEGGEPRPRITALPSVACSGGAGVDPKGSF